MTHAYSTSQELLCSSEVVLLASRVAWGSQAVIPQSKITIILRLVSKTLLRQSLTLGSFFETV